MVKRYGYTLERLSTPDATQDSNGRYEAEESSWQTVGPCRDEPNSKGGMIQLEDGQTTNYESIVFMPKSAVTLQTGDSIRIREGATVRLQGTIKRVSVDQLHCRLWV